MFCHTQEELERSLALRECAACSAGWSRTQIVGLLKLSDEAE